MFKKTIFLSNNEKDNCMGILTLESRNSNIFGLIKVFNKRLDGDYILGIKKENNIIKQNIQLHNNSYNFILRENINLNNNISCVLLKMDNENITPILWGGEKSECYKNQVINTLKENFNKLSQTHHQKISNNKDNILKDNCEYQENIHNNNNFTNINNITNNIEMCEPYLFDLGSAYSPIKQSEDYYHVNPENYSQISLEEEILSEKNKDEIAIATTKAELFESDDDEVENIIDYNLKDIKNGKHHFYDLIADQLNELFEKYPKEETLCKLIDNSHWVKIDTGVENKFHIVGIIMNNDDIKYICYGVPGNYSVEPPLEMREYSQWLPTNINDPYNFGYWVLYQDADTGENVKLYENN